MGLLRREGYKNAAPSSQIGIVGAAGGFRIGVVEPDGSDIWVSPSVSIGNATEIDDKTGENDYSVEVIRLLQGNSLVDLRAMPMSLRQKKIIVDTKLNQESLSSILDMVFQQTGIQVASDDYLNSRITNYLPVFREKEYDLSLLLLQLAKTFAHRIVYSDGILQLTTITRGLDLRLEPSVNIIRRLDILCDPKQKSTEDDFFNLGICTLAQLRCIYKKHSIKKYKSGLIYRVIKYYDFFKLISSLDKKQINSAFSTDGIAYNTLNNTQKIIYRDALCRGIPEKQASKDNFKPFHLYMQRKNIPITVKTSLANFSMIITGDGTPIPIRRFSLR